MESADEEAVKLAKFCKASTKRAFNLLNRCEDLLNNTFFLGSKDAQLNLPLRLSSIETPLGSPSDAMSSVALYHGKLEEALTDISQLIDAACRKSKRLSEERDKELNIAKEIELKYAGNIQRQTDKAALQAEILRKAEHKIEVAKKEAAMPLKVGMLEQKIIQLKSQNLAAGKKAAAFYEALESTTQHFDQRINDTHGTLEKLTAERDFLNASVESLKETNNRLQSDLSKMTVLLGKAEKAMIQLSKESKDEFIEALAFTAKSAGGKTTALAKQLKDLKDNEAAGERRRVSLASQLEEARAQIRTLEEMFSQVEWELKGKKISDFFILQ